MLALDTSVAVPLLMRSHQAHSTVVAALSGRHLVLTAHSLAETYSVLTRLPGDARALVGLAAAENSTPLSTRDARALGTYAAVGAVTEVLTD